MCHRTGAVRCASEGLFACMLLWLLCMFMWGWGGVCVCVKERDKESGSLGDVIMLVSVSLCRSYPNVCIFGVTVCVGA